MSYKTHYGFINEFGNFGFNFDEVETSTHFIVTAIIVEKEYIKTLETQVEQVRKRYFPTGEIKSSSIKNDITRIKILTALKDLNFHIFVVVVDKRQLYTHGGLGYKQSFYKFLNGLLHSELFRAFPKFKMVADEQRDSSFMKSFSNYFYERHIPNLFNESEFGFENSKNSLLIQLADFIAGILAKGFDEKKNKGK